MIKKTWFQILLIFLFVLFSYLNILNNQFVWDDHSFIQGWSEIRSFENLPKFFTGILPPGHEGIYRPIRTVLYAISFALWGNNPFGYHLQAIALHLLSTVLVFLIAKQITKHPLVAFLSGLLFGLHPVQTEAVSFATASFDLLGIVFMLSSFYLYLLFRSKRNNNFLIGSLFFAALGYFSHEIVLTLPIIVLAYELILGKKRWLGSLYYFILLLPYFFFRFLTVGFILRTDYTGGNLLIRIYLFIKSFLLYLYSLFWPISLNINQEILPKITNLDVYLLPTLRPAFDFSVVVFLVINLLLGVAAVIAYKKIPLLTFALSWFFITLLPSSNLISTGVIFSQRYLYLPAFGFCLIFALIANHFLNRQKTAPLIIVVLTLILFGYSFIIFARTFDFRNDLTLWKKTVSQSPNSAASFNNLGLAYEKFKDPQKALSSYQKAIGLNPNHAQAYNNSAILYEQEGETDIAVFYYLKALSISPGNPDYTYNLAGLYIKLGKLQEAEEIYAEALKIHPHNPDLLDYFNRIKKMKRS